MTRANRSLRNAARRLAVVAVLALAAPLASTLAAEGPPAAGERIAPDRAILSGKDIVLNPPDIAASYFSFLPDGAAIPFDRSLSLTAAPGESRAYTIKVSPSKGGAPTVASYVIDKRRPAPPLAEPGTGLYREAIKPVLSTEKEGSVFWALFGPDSPSPSFVMLSESARPALSPPAAGTATFTLVAYAIDKAGNRSYPSRFVYRLAEPELPAAPPTPSPTAFHPSSTLPKPEIEEARGYSELRMGLAEGSTLLVDVNPAEPPDSLDDFERIAAEGGVAKIRLPCAYGWSGELAVYYGIMKADEASYNPLPITVRLSNPPDDIPPVIQPQGPVLAADPAGRGSFIAFPSYDGSVFLSIDGRAPLLYESPILLAGSAQVTWYGMDGSGRRSSTGSASFAPPQALPDVLLAGVADGASIAGSVTLTPAAKATIRYEIRLDGSPPPEPDSFSPLLGDSLTLDCPAGEERSVAIRYRVFSGEAGGEGRILRFSLDRKPPDAPALRDTIPAYSDKPEKLVLLPGSGGKDIFASISIDGAPAAFAPVSGPIELPGSDAAAVTYLVRAYDADAAGNRSPEMKSLSFVVDKGSVFVAEDGSDAKGDGSPDRPYKSLDAAIAAALRVGKRSLNLRGLVEMRAPLARSTDLRLSGGYDSRWAKESSTHADLRIAVPKGQTAFSQGGGKLSLRRIDISALDVGSSPVIALSGSVLELRESSMTAGAEGDLVLVQAAKSTISMADTKIKATRAMACTLFSSDSSDISLSGCSIICEKGARVFGAFDMDAGELSLRECLVESRSDLGLNLISLRHASFLVDRSLFRVEGGSGFLRLGTFKSCSGEMKNSKVLLSWKGPGVLFEDSGGNLAFRHDSFIALSSKGGLRFFDAKGEAPQIWNCILECSGEGSELLRCGSLPRPGTIVADCVWGFDKLLAGAREASDLASLNALNAGSALYSSKPNLSESPERTYATPVKSQAPLRPDSACVNAALPIESGYDLDFSGRKRPGPGKSGPDIGADELGS